MIKGSYDQPCIRRNEWPRKVMGLTGRYRLSVPLAALPYRCSAAIASARISSVRMAFSSMNSGVVLTV